MSKFVVYLKLQPFVAQWLHHHFGNPVKFQPQSVENSTILQFTQKLPEGRQPDTAADGLTAVCRLLCAFPIMRKKILPHITIWHLRVRRLSSIASNAHSNL